MRSGGRLAGCATPGSFYPKRHRSEKHYLSQPWPKLVPLPRPRPAPVPNPKGEGKPALAEHSGSYVFWEPECVRSEGRGGAALAKRREQNCSPLFLEQFWLRLPRVLIGEAGLSPEAIAARTLCANGFRRGRSPPARTA